jgi:hypothetical protein
MTMTRRELIQAAAPLLVVDGFAPRLEDLSDHDVRRAVILVHDSNARLEGQSAAYLEARCDHALGYLQAAPPSADARRAALRAVFRGRALRVDVAGGVATDSRSSGGGSASAAGARQKLREDSASAWQRPLPVDRGHLPLMPGTPEDTAAALAAVERARRHPELDADDAAAASDAVEAARDRLRDDAENAWQRPMTGPERDQ